MSCYTLKRHSPGSITVMHNNFREELLLAKKKFNPLVYQYIVIADIITDTLSYSFLSFFPRVVSS